MVSSKCPVGGLSQVHWMAVHAGFNSTSIYVLTYVYAVCVFHCIKRVPRYNSRLSSSVNDIYVMCFIITGNNEIHTITF